MNFGYILSKLCARKEILVKILSRVHLNLNFSFLFNFKKKYIKIEGKIKEFT